LIATRLLIGTFEAGFYPTAVAYLSFFYTRYDLAVRIGLFYGQYAIAGAFSAAIAYGVFQVKNAPLHTWQYLFIIEGAIIGFVSLIPVFWLPIGPGSARFLSQEEREYAVERIRIDNELYIQHTHGSTGVERECLTKRDAVETAKGLEVVVCPVLQHLRKRIEPSFLFSYHSSSKVLASRLSGRT